MELVKPLSNMGSPTYSAVNTNLMSHAVASVLYDFNDVIVNHDGTKEVLNLAVHENNYNGKLFSGNPLDFQSLQWIEAEINILSTSTILFGGTADESRILGRNDWNTFVQITNNKLSFRFTGTTFFSTFIFESGKYYDVALKNNNTSTSIFVNGIFIETIDTDFTYVHSISFIGKVNSYVSNCKMDYLAIVDDVLSEDEIKRFTSQSEKAINDYSTNPELKAVFVTDFQSDGNYITNNAKRVETKLTDSDIEWTFFTSGEGNTCVYENGKYNIVNTIGSKNYHPIVRPIILDAKIGELFRFEVKIKILEGKAYKRRFETYDFFGVSTVYKDETDNESLSEGTYTYSFFSGSQRASNLDIKYISVFFNGMELEHENFKAELSFDIYKIEGLHGILNYSPTQRTNFEELPTGYQHLLFNPKGKGYIDTQYLIDVLNKGFTYETVFDYRKDNIRQQWGTADYLTKKFEINKHSNNSLYFYIGDIYITVSEIYLKEGKLNLAISVSINGTFTVYINGKETYRKDVAHKITELTDKPFLISKAKASTGGLQHKTYLHAFYRKTMDLKEIKTLFKLRKSQIKNITWGDYNE